MIADDGRADEQTRPGTESVDLAAELDRVRNQLEDERRSFRDALALGARELAARDALVEQLQARVDALTVRRNRLRARSDRLIRQRDRAQATVAAYEASRLARLALRVSRRLGSVRRRSHRDH